MSDNNININTPDIGPYTQLRPFRFWCQKVLPLVYDESLSYYELLCKVVDYLNKTMEDVDQMITDMGEFKTADTEFKTEVRDAYIAFSREVSQTVEGLETFINNYFNNLNVQTEINNKLDAMAEAGYFSALFNTLFSEDIINTAGDFTTAWIAANLLQETGYVIDKSLTVADAAADAKAVGDRIGVLPVNWNSGSYVAGNNSVISYGSYSYSDYIPVIPGEALTVKLYFHDSARLVFVNKNHEAVSNIENTTPGQNLYEDTITVPANAEFMRCSCLTANTGLSYIAPAIYSVLTNLLNAKQKTDFLNDIVSIFTPSYTDGAYLTINNGVLSSGSYSYSDFIPVIPGTKIFVHNMFHDAASITFVTSKFNGNSVKISYISNTGSNNEYNEILTVPANANYIRLSTLTAYKTEAFIAYLCEPALNNIISDKVENTYINPSFEQGGIDTVGALTNTTVRVRSVFPVKIPKGGRLKLNPNGQKCIGWFYKVNTDQYSFPAGYSAYYLISDSYITLPYVMETNEEVYFVFVVGKTNDADILPSEVTATFEVLTDNDKIIDKEKIKIESTDKIITVAHRGFTNKVPENTIPAFLNAYYNGFNDIECDIQFTADGVPVLLHDATIDRTSNGTGNIADLTYSYVRTLDFGSWCSPAYAGTKIPNFEEFLDVIQFTKLTAWIEIKVGTEAQIAALVSAVLDRGLQDKVIWVSGYDEYTTYVHNAYPDANIMFSQLTAFPEGIIDYMEGLKTDKNTVYLNTGYEYVDTNVDVCKEANIPLAVFLPNPTAQQINDVDDYVTIYFTDNINISHYKYLNYIES